MNKANRAYHKRDLYSEVTACKISKASRLESLGFGTAEPLSHWRSYHERSRHDPCEISGKASH